MRRALAALFAVAIVVPMVAACGSAVEPKSWATTVCQSLSPWRGRISSLNGQAQTAMTSAKTPAEARTALLDLLNGAQQASEKARSEVAAAGVPDVDGGAVIERRFVTALAGVRDAYAKAARTVGALPTSDADAFYSGVTGAMTTLNADYAASSVDTDQLASPELQADFDKVAACR
jgi:hypothetical protein